MSTWTCPRCLNTVVDQDVCSVCNTYQPPINTTASTINEKSNPMPQPTPISADQPPVMQPQSIEVDHLKPQTLSSHANERFEELIRANGSKTIYDRENDYIIEYTKEDGYVAFDINGKEAYHIYNDGTVSLTLSDGSKLHNYNSDLTIDDMKRTMKFTNDDGNDYYVTNRSLTKKVEYNHDWIMTTEETYGFEPTRKEIYSDGRVVYYDEKEKVYRVDYPSGSFDLRGKYFSKNGIYNDERDGSSGRYEVDKNGNITCIAIDGSATVYGGKTFKVLRTVDKDGTVTIYSYDNSKGVKTVTRNGEETRSKIGHIEYDEEAYDNILRTLNDICTVKIEMVDTCIDVTNTVNSFPDKYASDEIRDITNHVGDNYDLVSSLSEMTNYSVLAYQACDSNLITRLYNIVDSLFGKEDSLYSEVFKKEIGFDIAIGNGGILQYLEGTDFYKLGENIEFMDAAVYFVKGLNPERFGISKLEMYEDLKHIKETRGMNEYQKIITALKYNFPENFFDYHFNPGPLNEGIGHYHFDGSTIGNYQTNSEFISINGNKVEFTQVLPKDCTKTERLAYDFTKANVINTMKTFPEKYMKAALQKNNTIVLTCDRNSQNCKGGWDGYYHHDNWMDPSDGTVVINANGSLYNKKFCTVDTVIHEYGHKFDDILNNLGKMDTINNAYMTDTSVKWKEMYNQYKTLLPDIVEGGYRTEAMDALSCPNTEFFAESMVAYFKEPAELKRLCPEVYNEISGLLGDDYGGAYANSVYAQSSN